MRILFIDAFRPDYLRHAPFLRSLAAQYRHGPVITPRGFWGAMEAFYRGSSEILALFCRSEQSQLGWTRRAAVLGHTGLTLLVNGQRLAKGYRPFFRLPRNMPLAKLHQFDVTVTTPLTDGLNVQLTSFHDLDLAGHRFGPDSPEMAHAVRQLDRKIERLDFDVMISDHGMATVTKRITLPTTDTCFLDSTMARYWDTRPDYPENDGRWINGDERFGRHIFLANPGVMIAPNFWSDGTEKGMHGWDPEHPDMHAFYLIKTPGAREQKTMPELHKEIFSSP